MVIQARKNPLIGFFIKKKEGASPFLLFYT